MAVYGVSSVYGSSSKYGLDALPDYLCGRMSAQSTNYEQVTVTWTQPLGVIYRYRLLSSRTGYPINENDGAILIDQAAYPGSVYLDQDVIPGTYKYYGLYVQVNAESNIWLRSGVTACLANQDHGSAAWIEGLLPQYFRAMPDGSALPVDPAGMSDLDKFCLVMGWGLDYAKTQYAMFADHVNDPSAIPLGDLWNLADELGLKFSPEINAATVRKAVANASVVFRQRGTIEGLKAEIAMKTGWDSDVHIGQNILLEDDQSQFMSPIFLPYDENRAYNAGDVVYVVATGQPPSMFFPPDRAYWYNAEWSGNGYWYKCLTTGTIGVDPPADGTTTGTWECIRDADDWLLTLYNAVTGGINTWELLTPANTDGVPTGPTPFLQGLGVAVPGSDGTQNALNSLRLYNQDASVSTLWVRSLARTNGVVTGEDLQVDKLQVIKDAVPVPWVLDDQEYDATTEYYTNDLVLYQGQSFIALRQSKGAIPPTNNLATSEWAPLSYDRRIRLMISALTSQNMTNVDNLSAAVVPFVEWYDQWGTFITRVFARNNGTDPSRPNALTFDSFTTLASDYVGESAIFNWVANFYNNVTRTPPIVLTEAVDAVEFQWNSQSPGLGVNADSWSVNFEGSFVAPVTGIYTFGVSSSDGSAVWVNGVQIINNWSTHPFTHVTGTVSLTAGDTTDVLVSYYKDSGIADAVNYAWSNDPASTTVFDGWTGSLGDSLIVSPVKPVLPGSPVHATIVAAWSGQGFATLHWSDTNGVPLKTTIGDVVVGNGVNADSGVELVVSDVAPVGAAWVSLGATLGVYTAPEAIQTSSTETSYGMITFLNQWGYQVTEGSSNTAQYQTASYKAGLAKSKKAAAHSVTVLTPQATRTVVSITYIDAPTPYMFSASMSVQDATPSGIALDPITWVSTVGGPNLNGRTTDDQQSEWAVPVGAFQQGGYEGGSAWPVTPGVRSMALVSGAADGQAGVTFRSPPLIGSHTQGLVFRYSNDSNYWVATRTQLKKKVAGSWLVLVTYAVPFADNDRIVVSMDGSVINVFRNAGIVAVATVTDIFNDTAILHGIEAT